MKLNNQKDILQHIFIKDLYFYFIRFSLPFYHYPLLRFANTFMVYFASTTHTASLDARNSKRDLGVHCEAFQRSKQLQALTRYQIKLEGPKFRYKRRVRMGRKNCTKRRIVGGNLWRMPFQWSCWNRWLKKCYMGPTFYVQKSLATVLLP